MGVEYAHHRSRRARTGVEVPGDYERRDTVTSLAMGFGSILVPLVSPKVLGPITPGKGRYGKALVAGAVSAAAITTAADVVVRRLDATEVVDPRGAEVSAGDRGAAGAGEGLRALDTGAGDMAGGDMLAGGREKRRRWSRIARKVAQVGSVATVALGATAVTTAWQHATRLDTMWRRGNRQDLGSGVLGWTVAVVGWDFLYYWNHRFWHECRFLWANHVMHHSSERYNLSTALRQTVSDPWLVNVPYSLLALVGVRPDMVGTARSVNLIYQYWVHTDAIGTLGHYEAIGNTPSHHRVHHGSNRQYIDRNHAGILIIWDRLFGTFEPEDETVVYGLTKNLGSFNLARVVGREYVDILRDVANSTTWRDRLSFVLRGPGWAYERHRRDAPLRLDAAASASSAA
jgi:sterol desaturase/sphingolipid hydroxylase (fatty acid hydroxylase superfamily)